MSTSVQTFDSENPLRYGVGKGSAHVIIINGDKVLSADRNPLYANKPLKGFLEAEIMIGGKELTDEEMASKGMTKRETVGETLVRELEEEIGVMLMEDTFDGCPVFMLPAPDDPTIHQYVLVWRASEEFCENVKAVSANLAHETKEKPVETPNSGLVWESLDAVVKSAHGKFKDWEECGLHCVIRGYNRFAVEMAEKLGLLKCGA